MAYQLNNSSSKQQFSFSKNARFSTVNSSTPLCYDISSKENRKGGKFNKAPKKDYFKTSVVSPAPKYNIKSLFDTNVQKCRGSGMGVGRDELAKSNHSYINLNDTPGPGYYRDSKSKKSSSGGYTMGSRTRIPCQVIFLNEKAVPEVPGPGKYKTYQSVAPGGRMTSLDARFKQTGSDAPGPGKYHHETEISSYSRSLDKSTHSACSFSKQPRKTFMDDAERKSQAPGPGKYRMFSEFSVRKATLYLND